MIWVPDYQLVAALGAREATNFEAFLQTVAAESRDAAKGASAGVHARS